MAHKAVADGQVTKAERRELKAAAAALGLPKQVITAVLDEAHAARTKRARRRAPRPPDDWHDQLLYVGDTVVFAGGDPVRRARLTAAARSLGLAVATRVTAQTTVLVHDPADPPTSNTALAASLGTRIVSAELFAVLLHQVQPASSAAPRLADAASYGQGGLPDPAALRQWARERGFPVGTRGRIPQSVLDAYRAAYPVSSHTV